MYLEAVGPSAGPGERVEIARKGRGVEGEESRHHLSRAKRYIDDEERRRGTKSHAAPWPAVETTT